MGKDLRHHLRLLTLCRWSFPRRAQPLWKELKVGEGHLPSWVETQIPEQQKPQEAHAAPPSVPSFPAHQEPKCLTQKGPEGSLQLRM